MVTVSSFQWTLGPALPFSLLFSITVCHLSLSWPQTAPGRAVLERGREGTCPRELDLGGVIDLDGPWLPDWKCREMWFQATDLRVQGIWNWGSDKIPEQEVRQSLQRSPHLWPLSFPASANVAFRTLSRGCFSHRPHYPCPEATLLQHPPPSSSRSQRLCS